jgi:DNA-binding NarL/FixJ family response regulator
MEKKRTLLLVGHSKTYPSALTEVMERLATKMDVYPLLQKEKIDWQNYSLVLVDISRIAAYLDLIRWIRDKHPSGRIVVISPDPGWKQARAVLLAGAADYIRRSDDVDYLTGILQRYNQDPEVQAETGGDL